MSAAESDAYMEELAKRLAALEDQAYHEFADVFGPRFRAYFLKCGLATSHAEDLAASCVTDIALKIRKYRSREAGSFEAWVFTLARRSLIDWQRKHQIAQAIVPLTDKLTIESLPENELELTMDVVLAVRDAVAQLSESDQTIIQLRDLQRGYTYAEIGECLGIKPGTATVRHLRALKRLGSILEKDPRIRKLLEREQNRESREVG